MMLVTRLFQLLVRVVINAEHQDFELPYVLSCLPPWLSGVKKTVYGLSGIHGTILAGVFKITP